MAKLDAILLAKTPYYMQNNLKVVHFYHIGIDFDYLNKNQGLFFLCKNFA